MCRCASHSPATTCPLAQTGTFGVWLWSVDGPSAHLLGSDIQITADEVSLSSIQLAGDQLCVDYARVVGVEHHGDNVVCGTRP